MRPLLLPIGILCLIISGMGLSRHITFSEPTKPPESVKEVNPCSFDRNAALKDLDHISLSCWQITNGKWETQPVLVWRGEVYMFSRPQGYADKLKEMKSQIIKWRKNSMFNQPFEDLDNWIKQFEDAQREFK